MCVKILSILKKNKYINNKQSFNSTLKNKCELKRFRACTVYSRINLFWIYTTVSFFKTFFLLCVYVLKYLVFLTGKKLNNKSLENQNKNVVKILSILKK